MMVLKGSCNRCGKCCKPPVMLENPCIDKGEDRCKFYSDALNTEKYGYCLVFNALKQGLSIEKIGDRKKKLITKEQIRWFNDNCLIYPRLEDMIKGHMPPEGCGFYLEEAL